MKAEYAIERQVLHTGKHMVLCSPHVIHCNLFPQILRLSHHCIAGVQAILM